MNAVVASNRKLSEPTRVIGNLNGAIGPTVVMFGGVHGNESSGVIALQQVFQELQAKQIDLRGRFIGLAGNLPAISANKRFIAKDLNRIWNDDFLIRYRAGQCGDQGSHSNGQALVNGQVVEFLEQCELFEIISPILESESQACFIDLHSTSSRSSPFIAINDQLQNRELAFQFPVPVVLGIEEYLHGTLLNLVNDYGHIALAFEAGQHDAPDTVKSHVSFIYLALCAVGVIKKEDIEDFGDHQQHLVETSLSRQSRHQMVFEIVNRKAVSVGDDFRMNPGYRNFDRIRKNEILANDRNGPIKSPRSGQIFMPLYQDKGGDGFFIVRTVPSWALKLSSFLRRRSFESILTWLPGVNRDPRHADALIVDRQIAKFLATELFHLLGYRRKHVQGSKLIFSRREIRISGDPIIPP